MDPTQIVSAIVDTLGRAAALPDVYREALDGLQRASGTERASITLLDPGGTLRFVSWRGLSDSFRAAVEGPSLWPADAPNPPPIVIDDVETHPHMAAWRGLLASENVRALGFLPLVCNDRLFGKLAVYFDRPHPFSPSELELMQTVARLVAFAIERKGNEEKLTLYREIFANSTDPIAIVDTQGRFVEQNAAHRAFTGYDDAELMGLTPAVHLGDDGLARIGVELEQSGTFRGEMPSRRKTGEIRDIELLVFGVNDDGEAPRYFIGFKRDITERRRNESALRLLYQEAQEADRRKDEFLAMLAHELRNPLAPMVSAVQLARLRPGDPTVIERVLHVVERQARHMTRLVDDLLDVSRITVGKIELRREPTAISRVLHRALEACEPLIEARGLEVSSSVRPSLVVNADPVRLEQVFSNLIQNAAKYTDPAGRIEIRAQPSGDSVVITVSDNGIGIDPTLMARIFEPFMQGTTTLDRAQGGLGIGLTLVKRLTELHDGTVSATSDGPGRGSTFTVRLPLWQRVEVEVAGPLSLPKATSEETIARRILVVDDNPDAANMLAALLSARGHHVAIAREGKEAIETAVSHSPDVILLDIGLPGMDGYDVAQALRRRADFDRTTFIAISGYGQTRDFGRSRDAGFAHHLIKPIDLSVLDALLSRQADGPAGE